MRYIDPAEITPEHIFLNRRRLMAGLGAVAAGELLAACAGQRPPASPSEAPPTPAVTPKDEFGNSATAYLEVTGYNNYYEFSFTKESVAADSRGFKTSPWKLQVGGLVRKPHTYDLDELLRFTQEERVYRLRCVEAWSMVVPWRGFPLAQILKAVEPTPEAKFVRFETLYAPEEMPGQKDKGLPWPYVEGLRLDEAQHDLTLLATGLYGKPLTPQNGAPIRLVVPWKYGFKSIKSVVKIDLVAEMPTSFWMASGPGEYGFYANVNPDVPHPRWSQATERRIGEGGQRRTLPFNGYGEEVASLYAGMDLKVSF